MAYYRKLHRRDNEHLDADVDGIEVFYEQCVANGVMILKPLAATAWGTKDFSVEGTRRLHRLLRRPLGREPATRGRERRLTGDSARGSTSEAEHLAAEYAAQFGDEEVAAAYRYRPPYPAEAFAIVERLLGPRPRVVLELGAGTGDFTVGLAPLVDSLVAGRRRGRGVPLARLAPGGAAHREKPGSGRSSHPDRAGPGRDAPVGEGSAHAHPRLQHQSRLCALRRRDRTRVARTHHRQGTRADGSHVPRADCR